MAGRSRGQSPSEAVGVSVRVNNQGVSLLRGRLNLQPTCIVSVFPRGTFLAEPTQLTQDAVQSEKEDDPADGSLGHEITRDGD